MENVSADLLVTIGDPSQLSRVIKGEYLQGRPEGRCVLVGRSNVGKSSLVNALLFKKKLARVSQNPGKTRLVHCYWSPQIKKVVVDLPGYGYAQVARSEQQKWEKLISSYLEADPKIETVFLLLDSRHGPTPVDEGAMAFFYPYRDRVKIVMTKLDQLRGQSQKILRSREVKERLIQLGWGDQTPIYWVSVESQVGLDELRRSLEEQ